MGNNRAQQECKWRFRNLDGHSRILMKVNTFPTKLVRSPTKTGEISGIIGTIPGGCGIQWTCQNFGDKQELDWDLPTKPYKSG